MIERMIRASRLQSNLYEEVERDSDAIGQALVVVVIVAVASGTGLGLKGGVNALVVGIIGAVAGWLLTAAIAYWVGTTWFKASATQTSIGELLRTMGFAQSPGVLRILSPVPILGGLVSFAVAIWVFMALVVAVRQAMDFDTLRAIGTVVVGWLIQSVILAIVFVIF